MRTQRRIVVLGAGYAGLLAAARAAQAGEGVEVTLVNAGDSFVQRIRLHELLAGGQPRSAPLAPLLARRGIRFVQGYVDQIDPARERVTGHTADANAFEQGYDHLVVALGSRTSAPVPGVAAHTVRLDDPAAVRAGAEQVRELAGHGGRVLVIGGGLTAIEAATELAERMPGLRVMLATSGRFGAAFAPAGEAHLRARLEQLNITLHEQATISAVEAGRAHMPGGASIDFDACVWCGGFEASPIARESGLTVDAYGRIVVDAMLRAVGAPNIFAIGDAAAVTTAHGTIRMSCASAMPMGARLGSNLQRLVRGQPLVPFAMNFEGRCVSLGRTEGLFQWTEPNDRARPAVWTHRRAVWMKETICKMTYLAAIGEQRLGLPLYYWSGMRAANVGGEPMERLSA